MIDAPGVLRRNISIISAGVLLVPVLLAASIAGCSKADARLIIKQQSTLVPDKKDLGSWGETDVRAWAVIYDVQPATHP